MQFRYLIPLSLSAALLLPSLASAAPIKDAQGALYVDGLTPSSRATILYQGGQKTINVNSDACGRLVIRNSASNPLTSVTSLLLNGSTLDVSALGTDTLPRCINGTAEINQTTNYRTPANDIVIVGQTPLAQSAVAFPGVQLSRQATVNACGFIRLTSSTQYPLASGITVNGGSPIDYSSLSVGNPPRCINSVLYVPQ